jgi:glycine/D-amino acid oxidase-like deaminating enzyme
VDTTKGSFTCNRVVNCAGIDVGSINAMVGLANKVFAEPIQSNVTEPMEQLVDHLIYSAGERLTLKQTLHGSCVIGGGWPSLIDKFTGRLLISFDSVIRNLTVATDIVPSLESAQLVRTWPAWVNATDDWIPILGEANSIRGFFVCAFPWMGFTGGPISARILADMILSRPGHSMKI